MGSALRYALKFIAVTTAYVVAGKLGLDLAFQTRSVTAIWAPTGIALAALVLGGVRLWPAVALGALVTNAGTGVPPETVTLIAVGNTLEAVAGTRLLQRVGFRPNLQRVRDVLWLVSLAGILSTMIAATVGVAALLAGGQVDLEEAQVAWRTWWLGDMGGDVIAAPAILVAATARRSARPPGTLAEAVALLIAGTAVAVVVFVQPISLVYPVFPVLIWAALRFWQLGAAGYSLLVAVVAVAFTLGERGPFAAGVASPDERLLFAQTFVAVLAVTGLVLAAATRERRRAEEEMRELATTLQESLRPPALPEIPTIEAATYFRPAGAGEVVGGDFYDVFQVGSTSWGLSIGDVCGKGAGAAALTALARYTLRIAGARRRQPSHALATLNDVVRRERPRLDLCTAVYARLDLNGSPPMLTVASAGHPLPLRLRPDGHVEEVGATGMLLGVDSAPPLPEATVRLGPGETLIFYTDGLMDAYAPGRAVEVQELSGVLAPCAGRPPEAVVSAIERALLGRLETEPRDDIAIVVLRVSEAPGQPA